MDATLWGQAWNLVSSTIITLFGYAFQVLGAATTTLIALTILAAIFRLILLPLLGYNPIGNAVGSLSNLNEQRKKDKKEMQAIYRKSRDARMKRASDPNNKN